MNQENQDKIWDIFQNDEELGFHDGGRIEFIAKQAAHRVCGRILNIGVGRGRLEKLLLEKRLDVYSLDPSEATVQRLQQELSMGERAAVGYSQNMPFPDGFFSCVIMTEVLEHLSEENFKQTLSEVYRVLRKGGCFMGSVPADERLVDSIVVCPYCAKKFHRWGHLQSFHFERLTQELLGIFDKVAVRRIAFIDWKGLNWKGKISAFLRAIQAYLKMHGSGQNFFFYAEKSSK